MSPQVLLVVGLAAIFGALLAGVAAAVGGAEQRQVARSLAAVRALRTTPGAVPHELDPPFAERVVEPALRRLTGIGVRLSPSGQADRLRRRLDLAGHPARWDAERVLAAKALGLLLGAVLGGGAGYLLGNGPLSLAAGLVLGGGAGYFAPDLALYQAGYDRTERIRRELPDAIDLLTISVEAGLAFDAALAQVARNTEGPLAEELFRVLQEMQIGVGRAAALRALADRSDLPELRAFVGAMVQADSFGIPVARVLRVQSGELRVRRSQLAEERAQKVPVKILFPLVFCIMPALFIVVLGPAVIMVMHNLAHAFG